MTKKNYNTIFILLIISYVVGYMESFVTIGNFFKYVFIIVIITNLFKSRVQLSNYIPIFILIVPFIIIPFLLIIAGKYSIQISEQISNSFFYLIFIFLVISICEQFDNLDSFLKNVNIGILIPMIISVVRSGELKFNVFPLLSDMIDNSRTTRAFLGFTNPNTAGLIAMIGMVSTLLLSIELNTKRDKKLNLIFYFLSFTLYIMVIINSGSRTSILSPLISLLVIIIYYVFTNIKLLVRLSVIPFILAFLIFRVMLIENQNGGILNINNLNHLTSGRFIRQITTINYLIENDDFLFGIGNFNSSALYSQSNSFSNSLSTDNSPIYFLVTIGFIGLMFVLIILLLIGFKLGKKNYIGLYLYGVWIISSLFEHTLFVPSSLFSLFFITAIYISLDKTVGLISKY
ncbi:O-antigen ligase family protein [Enterococcus asini]|uniref:O-antigen ligase family protein n=1 Tax=Enterococcus asini TaxID=57732 RepID=UPI00288ED7C8|nr:O-antigen ligase family protein [Enterococcus asini]MDT2764813.1 O-antigen ligase family protein [Enterococcus asini]